MKLSLEAEAELLNVVNNAIYYECNFRVPSVEQSTTVVVIRLVEMEEANIVHIKQSALDSLTDDVRTSLVIALFKLVHMEMLANDGAAIQWRISDIGRFLINQFGPIDVAAIELALAAFVHPKAEALTDRMIVRID